MDIQQTSAALMGRPGIAFAGLPEMNMPWFESPFFGELLKEQILSPEDTSLVQKFADEGYLVLDDIFPHMDELAGRIIEDLARKYQGRRRLQDAWKHNADVKEIALSSHISRVLGLLYQRDPIPFQTLNFPVGTQQHTHSDTVHFHCVPHRFMCGVWVALEDITVESGPLHVYTGSHKLPVWNFHDLGLPSGTEHYHAYEEGIGRYIEALGLEKHVVLLKKGQALIWAANVLHGGEPILQKSATRHSQVTHYYFDRCLYYTPMLSDPYIGKTHLRTITDLRTGKTVPNIYNGQIISSETSSIPSMSMQPAKPKSIAQRVIRKLLRTIRS